MAGYESVSLDDHQDDFIGEYVRVITGNSHYRGECVKIYQDNNNVLLKNVVKKNETGWIDVSECMLIMGTAVESVYIEKSFPFDSHESLILSIEDGSVIPGSESGFRDLANIEQTEFKEDML
jgi:hypothetical protein